MYHAKNLGVLGTDSTRQKALNSGYINVAMDVSLWSSSVYILNIIYDARIHSSLKRKDFVKWPTYISVFVVRIFGVS